MKLGNIASSLLVNCLRGVFIPNRYRGTKMMSLNWQNLIVLDCCRYDYFKRVNWLSGTLRKINSNGPSTPDWLMANFSGFHPDIAYVSANPYISSMKLKNVIHAKGWSASDHFGYIEEVWRWGWDEELGTVRPETVVDASIKVQRKLPHFKKVIHFIQPHAPYIGETRIDEKIHLSFAKGQLRKHIKNLNKLRRAYRDNLLYVLENVEKLLRYLNGLTVITADHGELLGEYFLLGHPPLLYAKELLEVPWFIVDC